MMGQQPSNTGNAQQLQIGGYHATVLNRTQVNDLTAGCLPDNILYLRLTEGALTLVREYESRVSQLDAVCSERCALEEERNRLRATVDDLVTNGSLAQHQRISQLEARAERLEKFGSTGQVVRIRQLEAQFQQAQNQTGASQAKRISELEAQVLQLQTLGSPAQQIKISGLEPQVQQLQMKAGMHKKRAEKAEEYTFKLEDKVRFLSQSNPGWEADAKARHKLVTEHMLEVKKLKKDCENHKNRKDMVIGEQIKQIESMTTKLEHAEKDKKSRDDKIALLQSKVDKYVEDQRDTKKKTTELNDTVIELGKALTTVQGQLEALDQENGILRAEMKDRVEKEIKRRKVKMDELCKERKEKRAKRRQEAVEQWKKIWKGVVVDITGAQKKPVAEALEKWMEEFLNL